MMSTTCSNDSIGGHIGRFKGLRNHDAAGDDGHVLSFSKDNTFADPNFILTTFVKHGLFRAVRV